MILLLAGLLFPLFFCLSAGSASLSLSDVFGIITGNKADNITDALSSIVLDIRLPRVLLAALFGGALSLSGYLLQVFFQNPLAGPYVLGISSGAKLFVAILMIVLLSNGSVMSSGMSVIAAFLGSLLSMGVVLLLSLKVRTMSILIICGVMIGYICSAITDFIVTFASDSDIVNLHNWSQGSFSGMNWDNVRIAAAVTLITAGLVFLMAKPIGAYQLGENYARSMGVNIRLFRVALIVLSSILSATVTAYAGPISFVGIAVPHLIKRILNTSKPIVVIPACYLGGAVFCMLSDLIARTAFAPLELNISTVTSVFGAPVVIVMMLQREKEKGNG
jgi:iron complex transport system permease protein